jgi:7,8-dihydroneopterin aldolase/epimerase/oxygenase
VTDRIDLTGIEVMARHGVLPEERATAQPFRLDITLYSDHRRASESDDISDTIDYGTAAVLAHDIVATESHQLIERVANRVASALLDRFPPLSRVRVTVHKPQAPIPLDFTDVSVTVDRSR